MGRSSSVGRCRGARRHPRRRLSLRQRRRPLFSATSSSMRSWPSWRDARSSSAPQPRKLRGSRSRQGSGASGIPPSPAAAAWRSSLSAVRCSAHAGMCASSCTTPVAGCLAMSRSRGSAFAAAPCSSARAAACARWSAMPGVWVQGGAPSTLPSAGAAARWRSTSATTRLRTWTRRRTAHVLMPSLLRPAWGRRPPPLWWRRARACHVARSLASAPVGATATAGGVARAARGAPAPTAAVLAWRPAAPASGALLLTRRSSSRALCRAGSSSGARWSRRRVPWQAALPRRCRVPHSSVAQRPLLPLQWWLCSARPPPAVASQTRLPRLACHALWWAPQRLAAAHSRLPHCGG